MSKGGVQRFSGVGFPPLVEETPSTRDRSGARRRPSLTSDAPRFADGVGAAIRAARLALGWTQSLLATEADLSTNYVARLERGELCPSLEVAWKLSRALGCTVDSLIGTRSAPPLDGS